MGKGTGIGRERRAGINTETKTDTGTGTNTETGTDTEGGRGAGPGVQGTTTTAPGIGILLGTVPAETAQTDGGGARHRMRETGTRVVSETGVGRARRTVGLNQVRSSSPPSHLTFPPTHSHIHRPIQNPEG